MFFDLNIPIPSTSSQTSSKKGKGKQQTAITPVTFSPSQINEVEARIDLLVRLGYTVIAFNQIVHKKVEPKSHVNTVESFVSAIRQRPAVVYLKRLSIILDEDSEKGFGLTNANASLFSGYDLIGLIPLTQATFSLACLTHTAPSPLTAHIISLPLTLPRLSFHLKHTLIRTAIKNGAVFEISYVGALGGDNDSVLLNAGGAENGPSAKKNWWAAAREVVRVTKGKNVIISGGVVSDADLRAPRDIANLVTLLGLAQDAAHSSLTKVPKSVVLRAQTRKVYRAVLSEPKLVIPESDDLSTPHSQATTAEPGSAEQEPDAALPASAVFLQAEPKKRPHGETANGSDAVGVKGGTGESQKKKRKKGKGNNP